VESTRKAADEDDGAVITALTACRPVCHVEPLLRMRTSKHGRAHRSDACCFGDWRSREAEAMMHDPASNQDKKHANRPLPLRFDDTNAQHVVMLCACSGGSVVVDGWRRRLLFASSSREDLITSIKN
jgi:hypothetical protein